MLLPYLQTKQVFEIVRLQARVRAVEAGGFKPSLGQTCCYFWVLGTRGNAPSTAKDSARAAVPPAPRALERNMHVSSSTSLPCTSGLATRRLSSRPVMQSIIAPMLMDDTRSA